MPDRDCLAAPRRQQRSSFIGSHPATVNPTTCRASIHSPAPPRSVHSCSFLSPTSRRSLRFDAPPPLSHLNPEAPSRDSSRAGTARRRRGAGRPAGGLPDQRAPPRNPSRGRDGHTPVRQRQPRGPTPSIGPLPSRSLARGGESSHAQGLPSPALVSTNMADLPRPRQGKIARSTAFVGAAVVGSGQRFFGVGRSSG